jgi:hypothetical protein
LLRAPDWRNLTPETTTEMSSHRRSRGVFVCTYLRPTSSCATSPSTQSPICATADWGPIVSPPAVCRRANAATPTPSTPIPLGPKRASPSTPAHALVHGGVRHALSGTKARTAQVSHAPGPGRAGLTSGGWAGRGLAAGQATRPRGEPLRGRAGRSPLRRGGGSPRDRQASGGDPRSSSIHDHATASCVFEAPRTLASRRWVP